MLQRAASNAYSWWVASHIRTKQSKWLEQNLQDMEEKVAAVVKLISEDGDSFAKKAEMYYKKRPELLQFVEDSFRAYRALAERYDHISKELQNANSTLASAFPDQFQYAMDDDEEGPPKPRRGTAYSGQNPKQKPNIPEAPKQFPTKNIKAIIAISAKANNNGQEPPKKQGKKPGNKAVEALRAGFDKNQAIDEIDRLQKQILTKQTEKEFTKSSYESGVAKYWQIENEITEMQEKVSTLQDAFGVGKAIEDNEARTLMLEAALKSCQEKLAQLQEKQEKSAAEAKEERRKIRGARDKIMSFKKEILGAEQSNQREKRSDYRKSEEIWAKYDSGADSSSEAKELEMLRDKMKETFDGDESLSVSEMVDKIDELVNKVIKMESTLCSQTAMIQTMKSEGNELQTHIQSLEDEKANKNSGNDALKDKLKEMDQKLKGIQELGDSVDRRNSKLQTQFSEASGNLGLISQKLPDLKLDEENEESEQKETESKSKETQEKPNLEESREKLPAKETEQEERGRNKQADGPKNETPKTKPEDTKKGELEEKEKALMNEYTSVLENYKEIQKKLGEVESKSEESLTELQKLRSTVAKKDEEIQSLRQKLTLLQQKLEEYRNRDENNKPPQEPTPRSQNDNNGDEEEEEEEEDLTMPEKHTATSPVEVKLRADLDEILQENLNFWIRFSASYSAMQKFHHEVEDLQMDLAKIDEKKKNEMSSDHKSDVRAIYKHLKEIQTDMSVWVEQSMTLKSELQGRFSQLCHIKEEITRVLNENALDDQMRFTSLEAARFKGEVMNMQQENNRVEEELENSLSNMANLQSEVEGIISKLNEELGIAVSKKQTSGQIVPANKNQVPLRSFIFANKQQKKKNSILACVHPTLQKKYQQLKS